MTATAADAPNGETPLMRSEPRMDPMSTLCPADPSALARAPWPAQEPRCRAGEQLVSVGPLRSYLTTMRGKPRISGNVKVLEHHPQMCPAQGWACSAWVTTSCAHDCCADPGLVPGWPEQVQPSQAESEQHLLPLQGRCGTFAPRRFESFATAGAPIPLNFTPGTGR